MASKESHRKSYLLWKSEDSESEIAVESDNQDGKSSTDDIETGIAESIESRDVLNPMRPRLQSADSHFVPSTSKQQPTHQSFFLEPNLSRQFSFKQDNEINLSKTHGIVKTSRERKRRAARGIGGDFQMKNNKKKITSVCLSTSINIRGLFEHFVNAGILMIGWEFELYADVLHLYRVDPNAYHHANRTLSPQSITTHEHQTTIDSSLLSMIDKEVFVFNFGVAVFWGFHRTEVSSLLKTITQYVVTVKDAPEFKVWI